MNELDILQPSDDCEAYFQWLCGLVEIDDPDHSFWGLADILFERKFYWSVTNDKNRSQDGLELRKDYYRLTGCDLYDELGECTVLEMLIALAMRIDFNLSQPDDTEDLTVVWFWEMIENLGIEDFEDEDFFGRDSVKRINFVLNRWLDRRFGYSGEGSPFPLKHPIGDQRKTEIWYQMQYYLVENA